MARRSSLVLLLSLLLACGGAGSTKAQTPPQGAQPTAADTARQVPLEGALNGRDLGGLAGAHGVVPRDRVLRTGDLSGATEHDRAALVDHGVKLDIDLRAQVEIDKKPDALASDPRFRYVNISLLGPMHLEKERQLSDLYIRALGERQAAFREVFETIAAQQDGAVLYHCTAGKDRTGLVSAILLSLAGVDRDTIIHDYAISASYIGPLVERIKVERPEILPMMGTPPADMARFLDALDHDYGGARAYLARIGVSEASIAALETRLGQRAAN